METVNEHCRLCGEQDVMEQILDVRLLKQEFNVTADPGFCNHCMDSLSVHSTFVKQCSDSHQEINTTENGVGDTLLMNSWIKTEKIEIKCEEMDEPRYMSSPIPPIPHGVLDIKIESEDSVEDSKQNSTVESAALNYESNSEVHMYRCTLCTFETKYKESLTVHLLRHKDPSEVQMYKCDECKYETRKKSSLKSHMLVHKDPSEVPIYKCDKCKYETKHKNNLKAHTLMHKDPSEVQMYKCDKCQHKTKHEYNLKQHMLVHKDPSEVQMYKCDVCKYETKYKTYLKSHIAVMHKDPSQVPMHKCDRCKFETKHKKNLKKHMLRHKSGGVTAHLLALAMRGGPGT